MESRALDLSETVGVDSVDPVEREVDAFLAREPRSQRLKSEPFPPNIYTNAQLHIRYTDEGYPQRVLVLPETKPRSEQKALSPLLLLSLHNATLALQDMQKSAQEACLYALKEDLKEQDEDMDMASESSAFRPS